MTLELALRNGFQVTSCFVLWFHNGMRYPECRSCPYATLKSPRDSIDCYRTVYIVTYSIRTLLVQCDCVLGRNIDMGREAIRMRKRTELTCRSE